MLEEGSLNSEQHQGCCGMANGVCQLHRDNVPVTSHLVHGFFFSAKYHITVVCQPLKPQFDSLQLLVFPKAKIIIGRKDISDRE